MSGNPNEVRVRAYADQRFSVPRVCVCCTAPGELQATEKLYVGPRQFVLVPMPWCEACRRRRNRAALLLGVLMFAFGALGLAVPLVAIGATDLGYGIAGVGFLAGLILGAVVAIKLRHAGRRPGHAPGCDAVGSLQHDGLGPDGRRGGHLRFQNPAFAQIWTQANPPQ